MRQVRSMVISGTGIALLSQAAVAQWTAINLHPDGATESRGWGLAGGLQVGMATFDVATNQFRAGTWTGSSASWQNLHPSGTGTLWSEGLGIGESTGAPVIAGYTRLQPSEHASLWDAVTGVWTDLHPSGTGLASRLQGTDGVQHVGHVFFIVNGFGVTRATLWTSGGVVDLDPVGSTSSEASSVFAGKQAGMANIAAAVHAGMWSGSANSWVDLHPVGQFVSISRALAIHTGQQVGWAMKGTGPRASLWTGSAGSWVDLTPPNASHAMARGVYQGLQVGVVFTGSPGKEHAALWHGTPESWEDLNAALTGDWVGVTATGVWRDQTTIYVLGYGLNVATGRFEALLWQRPDCYADSDASGDLGIDDFITFQTLFALGDPTADCDVSGNLGIDDFICFQTAFAIGC